MKKYFVLLIFLLFILQINLMCQNKDSLPRIIINSGIECFVYIVKPKDGFLNLERKFDVKQDEIIKINPTIEKGLKIGQKIYIPVKKKDTMTFKISFHSHYVEKGQTIFSLCEKYGLAADDLIGYNPFLNNGLKAGQTLKIPIYPTSQLKDNQSFSTYIVEKGQTIYSLCKKYNISEKELIERNPILINGLKIGQKLKIPQNKINKNNIITGKSENKDKNDKADNNIIIDKIEKKDSIVDNGNPIIDTIALKDFVIQITDTTKQRILFFGDSMIETLGERMKRYAAENGHELLNVVWYSASTKTYAQHIDTLSYFINQFQPSYIFICLGANELFVRDLEQRDYYTKVIIHKIASIPYFWIGPPNWRDDTGINDVIHKNAGDNKFFLSKNLKFRRTSDGAHVTLTSAAEWLDTAIDYFNINTPRKINMNKPQNNNNVKGKNILLAPVKY